jgi:poly-gamma-glutamate synthesis protein (capsule biosynthesis protein)
MQAKHLNNKILFLGDVFLTKSYRCNQLADMPYMINLEAPFQNGGRPAQGKINLAMDWDHFYQTFVPLPLAVCLANNHILDYGETALAHTIDKLSNHRIPCFGAGHVNDNFANPLIIERFKNKIAIFGYCSAGPCLAEKRSIGPAPLLEDKIIEDITNNRDRADFIVLQLHWGRQESGLPDYSQIKLARKLIDVGANAVIGHHAHALQPVEYYHNGIIAYGLGNFIFSNLEIPSYYDHNGASKKIHKFHPRRWNRSSIGLAVDFDHMRYEIRYFFQTNGGVNKKKTICHRFANRGDILDRRDLDKKVKRNERFRKVLIMVMNFLHEPRLSKIIRFVLKKDGEIKSHNRL